MTNRDNVLSLFRREGYRDVPFDLILSDHQVKKYKENTGSELPYQEYFNLPLERVLDLELIEYDRSVFKKYYNEQFNEGTVFTIWGAAQEPSKTGEYDYFKMYHPMENFSSVQQVEEYPFFTIPDGLETVLRKKAEEIRHKDKVAVGRMSCTIWETSWFLRGLEQLMVDMYSEDMIAESILDKVTAISCKRAAIYARAGFDILHIGDDIGMQKSPMMSLNMYCTWLKPRLKRVIDTAKAINPNILVFYHTCGFVIPFISHLIECGIDILDPVQPESMDFKEVHEMYGDRISFNGTIGTQTTMPFGSPKEVREVVFKNLDIAGAKGGLLPAPTHVVEPEVPWENIIAYIQACKDYSK